MAYLIDTQAFIWYAEGDSMLTERAKSIIESDEIRFLSMASIWEMAIKVSLGKLKFSTPFTEMLPRHLGRVGYEILPVDVPHTFALLDLKHHHRDPFDRIIIAQAIFEKLAVVSSDEQFDAYPVRRVW